MARVNAKDTQRTTIQCAFCHGSGKDPFEIMSPLSSCCVCKGAGTVLMESPYVHCAFCHGSGVYPRSRQTCTACNGKGVIHVPEPRKTCPICQGIGINPDSGAGFYCLTCRGAGVVNDK